MTFDLGHNIEIHSLIIFHLVKAKQISKSQNFHQATIRTKAKAEPPSNHILEDLNSSVDGNLKNNLREAHRNKKLLIKQKLELGEPLLEKTPHEPDAIEKVNIPATESVSGSSTNCNKIMKRRSKQTNASTTTRTFISSKDIRTAVMLFVVTFLYILFFSPSMIATYYNLIRSLNVTEDEGHDEISFVDGPFILIFYLYYLNSAINPIIYCFLNNTFRKDLKKIFFSRDSCYNTCFFNN